MHYAGCSASPVCRVFELVPESLSLEEKLKLRWCVVNVRVLGLRAYSRVPGVVASRTKNQAEHMLYMYTCIYLYKYVYIHMCVLTTYIHGLNPDHVHTYMDSILITHIHTWTHFWIHTHRMKSFKPNVPHSLFYLKVFFETHVQRVYIHTHTHT